MTHHRTDVLILNTAVLDLRSPDFSFADKLVGPGGLAKCATEDMPEIAQDAIMRLVDAGCATAGGPGNTAPLLARAGISVAVGVNLGAGSYDGLDAQGRVFYDLLSENGVDMRPVVHPGLPTGTTFIHDTGVGERGGIAYFPNANNDFDFEAFKVLIAQLRPTIVYYMYSGLSDRGDANDGRDLAAFMTWCREQGCLTVADSHTLCADPESLIAAGTSVAEYRLLAPLLPELDLFFMSWDEARMIRNTLDRPSFAGDAPEAIPGFLHWLGRTFPSPGRWRLLGVTVSDGAYATMVGPTGCIESVRHVRSRYLSDEVVDLVGAGDSFRAGLIGYLARNAGAFRVGGMNVEEAVQMGNLMACLYIKSPLDDRYGSIPDYARLLDIVRGGTRFNSTAALKAFLCEGDKDE